MVDSTIKDMTDIAGTLADTDLFYAVRPGAPDLDFKVPGNDIRKLALGADITVTAAGRALIDDANAAAQRTTLGVGIGDSPIFTGLSATGLTIGSVAFIGASGVLSQDNSNLFWDNTNNRLGVGTAIPLKRIHIEGDTQDNASQRVTRITGGSAQLELYRANGTISVPTPVLSGNFLGSVRFGGLSDASNYNPGAFIFAEATENWSATGQGTRLHFSLSRNGITSPFDRLVIEGTGAAYTETSTLDAPDTADRIQYAHIFHEGLGGNGTEVGIGFSVFVSASLGLTDAPGAAITHERTGSFSAGKLHLKTRSDTAQSGNPVTRVTIHEDGDIQFLDYGAGMLASDASGNLTSKTDVLKSLIESRSATGATTNSTTYVTLLSSASTAFNGRPVMFMLDMTAFLSVAIDAAFDFAIQIDSGADNDIARLFFNPITDHRAITGKVILTPSAGNHVIRIRWKRFTGTGTINVDPNDQILLNAIEL